MKAILLLSILSIIFVEKVLGNYFSSSLTNEVEFKAPLRALKKTKKTKKAKKEFTSYNNCKKEAKGAKKGGKKGKKGAAGTFNRVSTFLVCSQIDPTCNDDTETAAEIVVATDDGMTLIYSDSPNEVLGMIDITDPSDPKALGTVDVGGEPTSVAVVGGYAVASINTSEDFVNTSGKLVVVDIVTKEIVATHDLGGQPDSVAVSPDKNFVAIAIENERDEDLGEGEVPQMPPGYLVVVDSSPEHPADWVPKVVEVTGLDGVYAPEDPEPEYVDINEDNILVMTMQENNAIVLVDLPSLTVVNSFTAGTVDLTMIDTEEEDLISMTSSLNSVPREPDGVVWISTEHFATADEGDMFGGSRGFTIYNTAGQVVYSSGNTMEHIVAKIGHYPEGRSENKGNEPENVTFGKFEGFDLLFVNSERSSVVLVYEVSDPYHPKFLQVLPAGVAPEGSKTIPSRGLMVAASEKDERGDKLRSVVNIYEYGYDEVEYPTIVSTDRADGTPIPWSALSGLVYSKGYLYSVEDSAFTSSRIFKIDPTSFPAVLVEELRMKDTLGVLASLEPFGDFTAEDLAALINDDMTINIDPEGIAVDEDGNYWVASEGRGTVGDSERPIESLNMLLHVTTDGTVVNVVTLPDEFNAIQLRFGLEGVAYDDGRLIVALQRAWGDEINPRIMEYHLDSEEWDYYFYPLEAPRSQNGGWVGLSDLTPLGGNEFLVMERDNQFGPDGAIKILTKISLNDASPGSTLGKEMVIDMVPELLSKGGLLYEKMEGLAVSPSGSVYVVNDNDGVGETQLLDIGCSVIL